MTGLLSDYRDPNNDTISHLLQVIASAGLADQITILGMVPDADLVNLMRTAAVVIQPSRFEGWSTVVQDSKALGRPLICSDIPVHREQAPESLGFFPCDGAAALADLLAATWPGLEPGPDPQTEERSLAAEREFARRHGQSLLRICQEASST
jgi:glycosyltransferase involved in cell wall biosynthesis